MDNKHVTFTYVGPLQSRGRLFKQIKTLQGAGFEVDLIAGNTQPIHKDQYGFPIKDMPVDDSGSPLKSFMEQMRFARNAAIQIASGDTDVVVCLGLQSLLAGVLAKQRRTNLCLIFDCNELHIESFSGFAKKAVWRVLHNYAIKRCDAIIHAESNRLKYFTNHYPVRNTPQIVIENFPFFVAADPVPRDLSGNIRLIYLGGFGDARYTMELVEAFTDMPDSVSLDFVGFGFKEYLAKVERRILETRAQGIRILPAVPHWQIPDLLKGYHIGLGFYKNTNLNNFFCAPNKIYDYLMNGIPVVTNKYPGLREVVEKNSVGVCLDQVDSKSLRAALAKIQSDNMHLNISNEIRKKYSWENQESKYLSLFADCAARK